MNLPTGVDTLNAMIAIVLDGAEALSKGAEAARDQRVKSLLAALAAEHDAIAARLQEEVRGLGGVPEDRGTVVGSAHRLYTEVKLALSPNDRRAMIEEIQRSEERVKEKFESLLASDRVLPHAVRTVVEQQFEQVRRAYRQVAALEFDGTGHAGAAVGAGETVRRPRRRRATHSQTRTEEPALMTKQRNEGEGNKTAAKEYNEATRQFVESGQVEKKADEAMKAREGTEREALERAEKTGKQQAKEEDPQIERDYAKPA